MNHVLPPDDVTLADSELADLGLADPDLDRAEAHLRALAELREMGMRLARALVRQAEGETDAASAPAGGFTGDLGLAFSRVARVVRQTVALEARVAGDRRGLGQALEAERTAAATRRLDEARMRRAARKNDVGEAVGRAIDAAYGEDRDDGGDEERAEQLLDDLEERLEDFDVSGELDRRPIGELVACLCAELGVDCDPGLWRREAWAVETAGLIQPQERAPP